MGPADLRDLVIYEAHLKDLTWQAESDYPDLSCYQRFAKAGKDSIIDYIKSLGVNAIEFLPLQKFAYYETPYKEETSEGVFNTWNPYAVNYWGYMTSFFFHARITLRPSDPSQGR